MKPRVRVGTSYDIDWAVFAADFDVTQNDSVGSDGNSQLLAHWALNLTPGEYSNCAWAIAPISKTTIGVSPQADSVCRFSAFTLMPPWLPIATRSVPPRNLGFDFNDLTKPPFLQLKRVT